MSPKRKPRVMWHSAVPDHAARRQVAEELQGLFAGGLRRPSELCFHTVILTDDFHGPTVLVWGQWGSPVFHAEYTPVTVWKTLDLEAAE